MKIVLHDMGIADSSGQFIKRVSRVCGHEDDLWYDSEYNPSAAMIVASSIFGQDNGLRTQRGGPCHVSQVEENLPE